MLKTSSALSAAKSKNVVYPNLILEIDGHNTIYSMADLTRLIRIGDPGLTIGNDWVIGGQTQLEDNESIISLDGSSTTVSQQLNQDKGGASSVSSIQISLIDFDSTITELVSPGFTFTEILGKRAWVYLGLDDDECAFPRDYPLLFAGIIDDISSDGNIVVTVAHPEQKKRQQIFRHAENVLAQALTDVATTIYLDSVNDFLDGTPAPSGGPEFLTYVKVDDEIILYTGRNVGAGTLTTCVRGQFGTTAVAHDAGATVGSFYRITGSAVDLALTLYLSGSNTYYAENIAVTHIHGTTHPSIPRTLEFYDVDLKEKYGVVIGDYFTTTGASDGANNVSLFTITDITVDDNGTVITCTGASFVEELDTAAVVAFKSQYNIFDEGLGMSAADIDVAEFQRIDRIFNAQFHSYDFYLTDTVEGKEFIDTEILYPSNMYSIPKRGKISVGVVSPPLAVSSLPILDASAIIRPDKIKVRRNLNKYLYNTVVYKYDFDAIENDKATAGYIRIDTDSVSRFANLRKTYQITSKGLRRNTSTDTVLDIQARRVLDRYKAAAEFITAEIDYATGFTIDVGDVVLFGDTTLPIIDTTTGSRGFEPRLCEVIDRKLDIKNGSCSVTLVDTKYQTDGRFGVISPSSIIDSGATTSRIPITASFGFNEIEHNKWVQFIGETIRIHNADFSSDYETTLLDVDTVAINTLVVTPIAVTPSAGWVVDIPAYPETTSTADNRVYKNMFDFYSPKVDVVTGVSAFAFTVGAGDASKFLVGAIIKVHTEDYSTDSGEVEVTDVTGTTITVGTTLGFTPSSVHDVDLIGFKDGGVSYRYL